MPDIMICLRDVCKRYRVNGREVAALSHVSMHIAEGTYTAIVGPSGSGKSTLMHLLGCLDTPSSGKVFLHGHDVTTLHPHQLAKLRGEEIGFVFQGFQLLPQLTALENVAMPLLLAGVPRRERESRAQELLLRVGLGERLHHCPSQLSGGQQQRVAIARALVRNPPILLADEPTGNLDEEATRDVLALLDGLHREGRTILLITHSPAVAACAQQQIVVSNGVLQGRLYWEDVQGAQFMQ